MATISADAVKDLRDRTGAGFMDCKRALEETDGDVEKAVVRLRERGLAAAAKRADRDAKEGLVESYIHPGNRVGVLIEMNCETDFVGKAEGFKRLVREIAMHCAAHDPQPVFVRRDEVEAQWTWVDAIRRVWADTKMDVKPYPAGSWGPNAGIALTERDGRSWHD